MVWRHEFWIEFSKNRAIIWGEGEREREREKERERELDVFVQNFL
jgi:hypothetical protein